MEKKTLITITRQQAPRKSWVVAFPDGSKQRFSTIGEAKKFAELNKSNTRWEANIVTGL